MFSGVAVGVFVAAFTGGYFYFQDDGTKLASNQSDEAQVASAEPYTQPQAASQPIALNQTNPTPAASGLQVGNNNSSNNVSQAPSSQLAVGGSGGAQAQGQSQSQSNPFDPKSFAQYDKYKNDNTASFADALVGQGAVLEGSKKAAVYYRGWLTNGTVFDESRAGADGKMTPFIFTMGAREVIPGWEQALAGMKVGGVRLVIVPPAAGYGAQQQNGIPPNSVLVFQVQLAEVQ